MKKILIPIDFSQTSKNALHYALDLFNHKDLEITILHIYGANSSALMMKSIDGVLLKNVNKEIDALLKEIKEKASDVIFNAKIAKNYPVSTITEMGNSGVFDLIVMGTKGVSGLKEVFMGSIAGGVVEESEIPVIVVPLDYSLNSINKAVFAVGDDSLNNGASLSVLKEIVEEHKSDLEVLNISDNEMDSFENVLEHIKDLNPSFTQKKSKGELNHQIDDHIQNNDIDLLCMLRTKKGLLNRFFNGSATLKQTFHSHIPILILYN